MVYHQRATWGSLFGAAVTVIIYLLLVGDGSSWGAPMLWAVGAGIVGSILLTILWGIAVGMRDREAATASDQRDRDISRFGGRTEHAVLIAAGIAVIVLCATGAASFWIANAMFAGFVLATVAGSIARLVAYQRGIA